MRWFLAFVALPLYAGTIDVSGEQSLTLAHGDTLTFELLTTSYTHAAQCFGMPLNPSDFSFAMAASPFATGSLSASLSSSDASITVAFDEVLGFTVGYLSSAGFQGAVSTIQGHLHLDPDLLSGSSVLLSFTNSGDDLLLGLPTFTMRQTMFATFSNGGLSAGATGGVVSLEHFDLPGLTLFSNPLELSDSPVPEPDARWLTLGSGVGLCAFSLLLNRLKRNRH